MVTLNYIDSALVKEKYSELLVRILKISNLVVHIFIVFLIISSVYISGNISSYNAKISNIKSSIEEKRNINKISDKEKQWDKYYYKLLAIKEQLDKNTNYGLVIKDLGTYFPKEESILSLTCEKDELRLDIYVKETRLNDLNSFYDYAKILKIAFEKSSYILKDEILVDSVKDLDSAKDLKVKTGNILEIKMPILSRK